MPFSPPLLWGDDAGPQFAASPKNMLPMYLVAGSGGKIPTNQRYSEQVYLGFSSTDLPLIFSSFFFLLFKIIKLSTPIIRNKLPLGLYLLLQLLGLREGQKEKGFKWRGGGVAVKIVFYSLAHPVCCSLSFPQQHYNQKIKRGEKKKGGGKIKVGGVGRGSTGVKTVKSQ